jgi:hypothetical protein
LVLRRAPRQSPVGARRAEGAGVSSRPLQSGDPHSAVRTSGLLLDVARAGPPEEALDASAEDGTRSILDIERVGTKPDYQVAAPFPDSVVKAATGSARPTRAEVNDMALSVLLESIEERRQCFYLTIYDGEQPSELFFAGYSFD